MLSLCSQLSFALQRGARLTGVGHNRVRARCHSGRRSFDLHSNSLSPLSQCVWGLPPFLLLFLFLLPLLLLPLLLPLLLVKRPRLCSYGGCIDAKWVVAIPQPPAPQEGVSVFFFFFLGRKMCVHVCVTTVECVRERERELSLYQHQGERVF